MASLRQQTIRHSKRGPRDGGQAMVELALCATVLLMLVFGIVDFGRAIYTLETLEVITNLAGEGSSLSSRGTSLSDTVLAVEADSSPLAMSTSGCVIATSVFNDGTSGGVKVSGQVSQCAISATSRIGTVGHQATLPAGAVPQTNQSVFVTEVFYAFAPITPVGKFLNVVFPSQMYDVAYY